MIEPKKQLLLHAYDFLSVAKINTRLHNNNNNSITIASQMFFINSSKFIKF